jgi:putative NADPH-quinone reductase
MTTKILIINGHPDPAPERLCAALANAYGNGARSGGHFVKRLDVGAMDFGFITSGDSFTNDTVPKAILEAQQAVLWADHIVIIFPLWLGGLPAKLKGFFEQTFRYGFALSAPGQKMRGLLKGRSARMIVTMGMPALMFRWVFGAHGVRAVERGMLWISGIRPIRSLFIGGVGGPGVFGQWIRKVEALGVAAK